MSSFKISIYHEPMNAEDDNVDVFVHFENGEKYVGSFFTLKNIGTIMAHHKATGESLNGLYFCSTDMIIIDKLTSEGIRDTVRHLLQEDTFYVYFSPVNEKAKIKKEKKAPISLEINQDSASK